MNAPIGPFRVSSRATGLCLLIAAALLTFPVPVARAAGGDPEEARAYFDKATASFALGRYAVAAESFEKAFEAKPDSALLYNAAQAHRLAGNKERALILYKNYLRIYPKAPKRAEVEARVDELAKGIEHDRVVATTPPTTTIPLSPSTPAGAEASGANESPAASPSPSRAGAPVVASGGGASAAQIDLKPRPPAPTTSDTNVATRAEPAESQSLTRKPLFWAAVGGAVVAAMAVILVVALSGAKDPSPSLGVVR